MQVRSQHSGQAQEAPAARASGSRPKQPVRPPREARVESLTTRRTTLLSVAGLAWGPGAVLDAIKGEASLWQQEAELYGRKASEALASQLGAPDAASRSAAATAAATDSLTLDAGLAAALLEAPLLALQQWGGGGGGGVPTASSAAAAGQLPAPPPLPALDEGRYRADFEALLRQELPFFRDAGACGHCGAVEGPGALTDRAWLDFLSYIQFKALGRQLGAALAPRQPATLSGWERMHAGSPEMQLRAAEQAWLASGQRQSPFGPEGAGAGFGGSQEQQLAAAAAAYRARGQPLPAAGPNSGGAAAPPLAPVDALRLAVGEALLQYIAADLAVAGASDAGAARQLAAIRTTSPELDSIRAGAQALLQYFTARGYAASIACEQLGLSQDEYENHYVWSLGEPAFIKYWLERPATLRSSAALEQEEGFSQDFVAAALQAYLRRCGVASSSLKRYASYSQPQLVANQWTLRRLAPLPEGYDWQQYAAWAPDFCPLADDACY